jgi:hypothetical protein
MKIELERLGAELLDQLLFRQAEIEAEHQANEAMIAVIQKRLSLETATPAASTAAAAAKDFTSLTSAQRAGESSRAVLKYEPEVFFNLSQKEAVIKLLKLAGRPMPMLEIIDVLKKAEYPFKAESVYQSLFGILKRASEITKHGKLFGLKEWSRNGTVVHSGVWPKARDDADERERAEREFEQNRERLEPHRQAHDTDED